METLGSEIDIQNLLVCHCDQGSERSRSHRWLLLYKVKLESGNYLELVMCRLCCKLVEERCRWVGTCAPPYVHT